MITPEQKYRAYKHNVLMRAAHDDKKYKAVRSLLFVVSSLDIFLAEESNEAKKEELYRDLQSIKNQIEDVIDAKA